jgi:RNA polymerase sigma-70 factor (ECF subfamily)
VIAGDWEWVIGQLTGSPDLSSVLSSSPGELLSDEQLVARTLAGQRQAFNDLVARHERRLFRFLSKNARNEADVEDAMQHAFVKAFTKLASYDPRWRFTTWLFTIALRELRSLHRVAGPRAAALDAGHEPAAPAAPDREPGDLWALAKRVLSPRHYAALWLRYGEDLPARDIAKVMNRPRIWVSVTLHRACTTVREAAQSSFPSDGKPIAPTRDSSNNRSRETGQGVL